MEIFMQNYNNNRNETIAYDYVSHVEYGPKTQPFLDVEMTLDIPNQEILYIPGFWQLLKVSWVKYFSSFIFFYILLHRFFMNFIITNGAFESVSISEMDTSHCSEH